MFLKRIKKNKRNRKSRAQKDDEDPDDVKPDVKPDEAPVDNSKLTAELSVLRQELELVKAKNQELEKTNKMNGEKLTTYTQHHQEEYKKLFDSQLDSVKAGMDFESFQNDPLTGIKKINEINSWIATIVKERKEKNPTKDPLLGDDESSGGKIVKHGYQAMAERFIKNRTKGV